MAEKRDPGKKWVYPTLSLLLHLVLISILSQRSWTDLGAPKVLSSLPVQVRWAAWTPPESAQPQRGARENIGAVTVREREGKGAGVPGSKGAVRSGGVSPLLLRSSAPRPKTLPRPLASPLLRPKLPSSSVPPVVLTGVKPVTGSQSGEKANGAPPMDLSNSETPGISPVASPSVLAVVTSAQEPGEKEQTGKGTTALAEDSSGDGDLVLAEPRYRKNDKPVYPRMARLEGYEGTVFLEVEVRSDGRVGKVGVKESSNFKVLDEAAVEAVRKWLFSPAKRGGTPITSRVVIPIRFQLIEG